MDREEFKTTRVLLVTPDTKEATRDWLPKFNARYPGEVQFTILHDPQHKVVNRYGIFNEKSAGTRYEVPHPTTYIIDKKGVVRWKDIELDYRIRPANEQIIEALSAIK